MVSSSTSAIGYRGLIACFTLWVISPVGKGFEVLGTVVYAPRNQADATVSRLSQAQTIRLPNTFFWG